MTDTTTITDTTQETGKSDYPISAGQYSGTDYIWTGSAGGTGCFLYRKTGDKVDQEDCEAFI